MSEFKKTSEQSLIKDRQKSKDFISDSSYSPERNQNNIQSSYVNSVHRNSYPNNILAIFGLDLNVNENDLYKIYTRYGSTKCKVIKDQKVIIKNFFNFTI